MFGEGSGTLQDYQSAPFLRLGDTGMGRYFS